MEKKLATSSLQVWTMLLGVLAMVFPVSLLGAMVWFWPSGVADCQTRNLSDDVRLMCMVIASGALGAYVHAATSFVTFVGNRRLKGS